MSGERKESQEGSQKKKREHMSVLTGYWALPGETQRRSVGQQRIEEWENFRTVGAKERRKRRRTFRYREETIKVSRTVSLDRTNIIRERKVMLGRTSKTRGPRKTGGGKDGDREKKEGGLVHEETKPNDKNKELTSRRSTGRKIRGSY